MRVTYGPVVAVHDFDAEIEAGEIVAVLGANGAGKSSVVRGLLAAATATVKQFIGPDGKDLRRCGTSKIIRSGVAVVPERRRVFGGQSVEENLLLGAYTVRDRHKVRESMSRVYDLFPALAPLAGRRAGALSGGEQQMLAIGRGLMAGPRLLIMDEPSLGLAPVIASQLFNDIQAVAQSGVGVLLAEENAVRSLAIANRVVALQNGHVAAAGTVEELGGDDAIHRLYLGGQEAT
ncbi:ABC transporter ATP-binding protein [Nocardioides pyridinolyticus]